MLPLFVYAALTAFGETPVRLRKKKAVLLGVRHKSEKPVTILQVLVACAPRGMKSEP
jgi:hypothetical protein